MVNATEWYLVVAVGETVLRHLVNTIGSRHEVNVGRNKEVHYKIK